MLAWFPTICLYAFGLVVSHNVEVGFENLDSFVWLAGG